MIRYLINIFLISSILFPSSKVAIAIKTKGDVSVIYKGLNSAQVLKPVLIPALNSNPYILRKRHLLF